MSIWGKNNPFICQLPWFPEWQWHPELVLSRKMREGVEEEKHGYFPETLLIEERPLAWQDPMDAPHGSLTSFQGTAFKAVFPYGVLEIPYHSVLGCLRVKKMKPRGWIKNLSDNNYGQLVSPATFWGVEWCYGKRVALGAGGVEWECGSLCTRPINLDKLLTLAETATPHVSLSHRIIVRNTRESMRESHLYKVRNYTNTH